MVQIEVCFSPLLFPVKTIQHPYILVVADILRATTTMCTAFEYGVNKIIPVSSLDEARKYKALGYIIAGERDGNILDFADIGNSPAAFISGDYSGKSVVFTTTNGTVALNLSNQATEVVLGAFSNLSVLGKYLLQKAVNGMNVMILCSGWYQQFSLEDAVFAGALSEKLLSSGLFSENCDSVKAGIDLWQQARTNLHDYFRKASHLQRLISLGQAQDLEYCFTIDTVNVVPCLKDGVLLSNRL